MFFNENKLKENRDLLKKPTELRDYEDIEKITI